MKTQKINSIQTVTAATLAIVLLTFAACSGKEGTSINEKEHSPVSQTNVKPPKMDIHTATVLGDIETIQQHIEAGSDLNFKEPAVGSTPLITAAVFGKTEVAKALIEAGADVNIQNNEGSTPLHTAAFFCYTEIVKMLLDNGADKNIRNNAGSIALESVAGPFDEVKVFYDYFSKELGPMGLKLDYEQLKVARPRIAEMLR